MSIAHENAATNTSAIPSLWENGITLQGVSWETYAKFVDSLGDRRVFVSYDRGLMEIQTVSPSYPHEYGIDLLVSLIHVIRFQRGTAIAGGGSTTHRREDLERGVEPDACFWIENEPKMRGVKELDLNEVPPPDLVIEVDIHSSSVDRIETFCKLGVPEIWLIRDEQLYFLVVDGDQYAEALTSRSFPFVDCASVNEALKAIETLGESEALNQLLTKLKLR
ncbi:Uma2 family endonuclease [Aeoliella mucimassa]|uniref:Putative restriction endonuclease domain-containing protein n=1 Tax=Aeoliella mucimassa TaxID=2527972 RepID=A0A518AMB3_9BACT|nr:Uma2 family endonuclease [Aeoliella mucimassa]QDU55846.1 hypothetical protein Pan181_20430 [Aeoliella mucimassa]